MKLSLPLLGAITLAIAALSGTGGYFLGKNSAAGPQQSGAISESSADRAAMPRKSLVAALDTAKLRAALDAETNPLARIKRVLQNIETWVAEKPQEALAWLATQQPSDRRDEIMRMALNQYSETDPKGAAQWAAANLTGIDLNNTLIAIAENWALQNGTEAAAWFTALAPTAERDAALENIWFSWATNEPTLALEFLKANPSLAALSPTLRRAALAGWAKTDPLGAVNASLELSRIHNDTGQFTNTLANWATMDLAASSQWLLKNLPAGAERTAASRELAVIFAGQSPAAGVTWLEKLPTGAERDAAASALLGTWSRSGPADAARWASSQTLSNLSPQAIAKMNQNFILKNTPAFEAWRDSLPPGPLKEQAAKALVASSDEE